MLHVAYMIRELVTIHYRVGSLAFLFSYISCKVKEKKNIDPIK